MICCVTGHRSKGFPFLRHCEEFAYVEYIEQLRKEIRSLIDEGYDHFISGMAEGVDLDFASCVLELGEREKGIILEAALPCPISSLKDSTNYIRE